MKGVAKSYLSQLEEREEPALEAFARAMASRPLDMKDVEKTREEVRQVGGEGLVVESSTVVGGFALTTKVVDGTARFADPNIQKRIRFFLSIKKHKNVIKLSLLVGVVAIFASRWRK